MDQLGGGLGVLTQVVRVEILETLRENFETLMSHDDKENITWKGFPSGPSPWPAE